MRNITRIIALAVALISGVTLSVLPQSTAHANGVPQLLKLTYLPGLSNFGSTSATGVLEFSFADGYLRLDASGLTVTSGRRYEGWLVKSGQNNALSVGTFAAGADGSAHFETTLPVISDYGYDLFLLTVEPEPDDATTPSADRSIGGYFSVVGPPGVAAASNQIQPGGPAVLPNTGDAGYFVNRVVGGATGGALALAFALIGLSVLRRKGSVR